MKEGEVLEGAALDAAVAKALGYVHEGAIGVNVENDTTPYCLSGCDDWWRDPEGRLICAGCMGFPHAYSEAWEHGGPVIERAHIEIGSLGAHGWQAAVNPYTQDEWALSWHDGPTPLVAAMRAFVAAQEKRPA
jgi:hypothetical protein